MALLIGEIIVRQCGAYGVDTILAPTVMNWVCHPLRIYPLVVHLGCNMGKPWVFHICGVALYCMIETSP
jgi:hypothetical protein